MPKAHNWIDGRHGAKRHHPLRNVALFLIDISFQILLLFFWPGPMTLATPQKRASIHRDIWLEWTTRPMNPIPIPFRKQCSEIAIDGVIRRQKPRRGYGGPGEWVSGCCHLAAGGRNRVPETGLPVAYLRRSGLWFDASCCWAPSRFWWSAAGCCCPPPGTSGFLQIQPESKK